MPLTLDALYLVVYPGDNPFRHLYIWRFYLHESHTNGGTLFYVYRNHQGEIATQYGDNRAMIGSSTVLLFYELASTASSDKALLCKTIQDVGTAVLTSPAATRPWALKVLEELVAKGFLPSTWPGDTILNTAYGEAQDADRKHEVRRMGKLA